VNYADFLDAKTQLKGGNGFKPLWIPDLLFDFQKFLVDWSLINGRTAMFADCGMGKTLMQLVWAENVVKKTNKNVLILAPLAVTAQTVQEGEKFGIKCTQSRDGKVKDKITITNYEQLHKFNSADFVGVVCDESSILKSFKGSYCQEIISFMRKMPYRLLATATPSPNDFVELGRSSEALGFLGAMDMMNKFFKNDQNNSKVGRFQGEVVKWRLKGHAEKPFWRWVCSWARACRKPSDLGFKDDDFILPPKEEFEHVVESKQLADGFLFALPARGLKEQREENRRTINERCEKVAEIVNGTDQPALVWANLNAEGDLLESLIPDSIQVAGKHSDDAKVDRLMSFAQGKSRVLVTKPKIGAWGLNFQHCNRMTFFPSHSFEQMYQGVRRCWRFGQKRPVRIDLITTEGEGRILKNLKRKAEQADEMFENLVAEMNNVLSINRTSKFTKKVEVPSWL
jgi:hypothetical protein